MNVNPTQINGGQPSLLNQFGNTISDIGQGIRYTATPEGLRQLPSSIGDTFQSGQQALGNIGNGIRNFATGAGQAVGGASLSADLNKLVANITPEFIAFQLIQAGATGQSSFVTSLGDALTKASTDQTIKGVTVGGVKTGLSISSIAGDFGNLLKRQLGGDQSSATKLVKQVIGSLQSFIAGIDGWFRDPANISKLVALGVNNLLPQPLDANNPDSISAAQTIMAKGNTQMEGELGKLKNQTDPFDQIWKNDIASGKAVQDKALALTNTSGGGQQQG